MPVYDYRCAQCGEFSALRKMSESSLPCTCENCGELAPYHHGPKSGPDGWWQKESV